MRAEAGDHRARMDAAAVEILAAACAVDDGMAEVRARLARFQECAARLRDLHAESVAFNNTTMASAPSRNPVLRERHPSEHPCCVQVPPVRLDIVAELTQTSQNVFGADRRAIGSLASLVVGLRPAAAPRSEAA